jgi:hypothetical protein
MVGKMTSQIAAAAARYGVSPEAIAGALAQEQFDQSISLTNLFKALGSSVSANIFLDGMYELGRARTPSNPRRGASDKILDLYNADPRCADSEKDAVRRSGSIRI